MRWAQAKVTELTCADQADRLVRGSGKSREHRHWYTPIKPSAAFPSQEISPQAMLLEPCKNLKRPISLEFLSALGMNLGFQTLNGINTVALRLFPVWIWPKARPQRSKLHSWNYYMVWLPYFYELRCFHCYRQFIICADCEIRNFTIHHIPR
jgi:hypothetical protein